MQTKPVRLVVSADTPHCDTPNATAHSLLLGNEHVQDFHMHANIRKYSGCIAQTAMQYIYNVGIMVLNDLMRCQNKVIFIDF